MDRDLNVRGWAWRAARCAVLLIAPVGAVHAHPGGSDHSAPERAMVEEEVIELIDEAPASQNERASVHKRIVIKRLDGEAQAPLSDEGEDGAGAKKHVRIRIVKRSAQEARGERALDPDASGRERGIEDRRDIEIERSGAVEPHKRIEIRRERRAPAPSGEGAAETQITLEIGCTRGGDDGGATNAAAHSRRGDTAELGEVEPRLNARCEGGGQGNEQEEILAAIRTAREEIAADEALDEPLRAQILAELDALIAERGASDSAGPIAQEAEGGQ